MQTSTSEKNPKISLQLKIKVDYLQIVSHNNSHDDTIDSYSLTEDDTDKVFGFNARCFNTTTQYASSCGKNTPEKKI